MNITLQPLEIPGYLTLCLDAPPTPVAIDEQTVVLNRINLNIEFTNNKRSGGIMFNLNGYYIQTTDNCNNVKA